MFPTSISLSRRAFLAGSAASAVILSIRSRRARRRHQAHLRIMETTDIHVNVLPYDYYADKPNDTMGLSRTASLIDAVRKEATNAHADRQWRLAAGQARWATTSPMRRA